MLLPPSRLLLLLLSLAACEGHRPPQVGARGTPAPLTAREWFERARGPVDAGLASRTLEPTEGTVCRKWVGYPPTAPLERCTASLLAGDAVVLVSLATECGGDSCSVRAFAYSGVAPGFVELRGDLGGNVAASPRGDFLVVDTPTAVGVPAPEGSDPKDPFGGKSQIVLDRVDLPGLARQPFAPCFSPVLSPGGRYFVCRDRRANVLRVAVRGGPVTRVATSGVPEAGVDWVPYAYVYPQPVEFPASNRLRFLVQPADGEPIWREIPWKE